MDGVSTSLGSGIVIGVAVSAQIGPMSVLCVQRALTKGFWAGLATGFGAALTQVTWGAFAFAGKEVWSPVSTNLHLSLGYFVSAALLAWFSFRTLRKETTLADTENTDYFSLARGFLHALTLGLANPLTIVLVAAAYSSLLPGADLRVRDALAGQFCGAIAWWLLVVSVLSLVRERFDGRVVARVNVGSGLILGFLSLHSIARGCGF